MRFGENNVLCPKYIVIYEFWGYEVGAYMVHRTFFIIKKMEKVQIRYRLTMYGQPVLKSKSNSTSFFFFFKDE